MIIKTFDFSNEAWQVAQLFKDESHFFFLESSQLDPQRGRYSFIGFKPFNVVCVNDKDNLNALRSEFECYANNKKFEETPLSAGIVGFLSYDYGLNQENITSKKQASEFPDYCFGFYGCIITVDHFENKLHVTALDAAKEQIDFICQRLESVDGQVMTTNKRDVQLQSNVSQDEYVQSVKQALDYISEGDIYQINLSHKFQANKPEDFLAWDVYQSLRQMSPSSFGGFFKANNFTIISSSPERFLKLKNGILQTRPMKGTRPRGKTQQEDDRYKQEILTNEKEKAELLMITDLERNDLGRVCQYGSVKVRELRTIEEYNTVFQATSTIEGVLDERKDPFDILQACFPGGSITGCPKIRSMEIVDELENHRRGIYTGALGYISFDGNMDFNILIRTLVCSQNTISFQVGSGIVADSDPVKEYHETLLKAQAIRNALSGANPNSSDLQQHPA